MAAPMGCMVLQMDFFDDAAQIMDLPKGDLFGFGLNPYNGNIVISYQDNPCARFFTRLILDQLSGYDDVFSADDSRDNKTDVRSFVLGGSNVY